METSDTLLDASAGASPAPSRPISSSTEGRVLPLLGAAIVTFIVWRGALYAFDLIGLSLTPNMGNCRKQWEVFGKGHEFWNGFFRWDAGWYSQIARNGYSFKPGKPSSVAFYPLFPYLARYVGAVFNSPFIGGLIVSHAAAIGALFYVRRAGAHFFSDSIGKLATILLLVFPTSFFLTAFYTEGLFLCLAAGAVYHYARGQLLASALLGFGATLTRSTGMVLFIAVALDLGYRLLRREEVWSWRMLWLLLMPAGLGTFMLMLEWQVGDPLSFTKGLEHWDRRPAWPWESLVAALAGTHYTFDKSAANTQRFIDALAALSFLAIGALMALRRERVVLWSFVVLGVIMPLTTYNLASMNRYVLALFPAFFFMAKLCEARPALERWWIFASAFFLAIYSLRFMQCGWAG
jgi:hypothetical protein